MQRQKSHILRVELETSRLDGESNVSMMYRCGIPIIIKIPPRKRIFALTVRIKLVVSSQAGVSSLGQIYSDLGE